MFGERDKIFSLFLTTSFMCPVHVHSYTGCIGGNDKFRMTPIDFHGPNRFKANKSPFYVIGLFPKNEKLPTYQNDYGEIGYK